MKDQTRDRMMLELREEENTMRTTKRERERAQITDIHKECEDVCQEVGLTFS